MPWFQQAARTSVIDAQNLAEAEVGHGEGGASSSAVIIIMMI